MLYYEIPYIYLRIFRKEYIILGYLVSEFLKYYFVLKNSYVISWNTIIDKNIIERIYWNSLLIIYIISGDS